MASTLVYWRGAENSFVQWQESGLIAVNRGPRRHCAIIERHMRLLAQIAFALALSLMALLPAVCQQAKYVAWGVDEYEFFGLTKQQLASQFKGKLTFAPDFSRAVFGRFEACHSYDGATFKLFFDGNKVSKVQRVFVGCNETQEGPVFESKQAALKFAIDGLAPAAQRGLLKSDEMKKLSAAKKMLLEKK